MMEVRDTLYSRIVDAKRLTPGEIVAIMRIIGKDCSGQTNRRLRYHLRQVPGIDNYPIFRRMWLNEEGANTAKFHAGQDTDGEIRLIRQLILKY